MMQYLFGWVRNTSYVLPPSHSSSISEPMALMASMENTFSKVRVGKEWVFGGGCSSVLGSIEVFTMNPT
jgi:hypothetical protein